MAEKRFLVLNGPNLNLLGRREPEIYGRTTLADIEAMVMGWAGELGVAVDFRQSNHEGELVEWIHDSVGVHAGIAINAGAYTHTSIALHDALKYTGLPVVEVHLSNVFARDAFRHHSYIAPLALGVVCGFGAEGYRFALQALVRHTA